MYMHYAVVAYFQGQMEMGGSFTHKPHPPIIIHGSNVVQSSCLLYIH